ncbi:hypothetical protein EZ428_02720 [Pedobacter frigiditerrae]|uniref:Uncharacterized protein n=1 Tax=Pedobacter frigiditerrae TaxID=2530452 RepID=A0A4R0N1N9_9SPHI|nr:hypothetical protein [Pedobacter frigiditerrae]TCC93701.1 hypothetical protein EZ428_02720 [Pedobacter frigiditerrae]
MATEKSIVAHSSFHFEDLQLSSQKFYQSVEDTLNSFEYPNLRVTRVNLSEGTFITSSREYLCIQHKEHLFYVCAAPFGRSYFISWWLKEELSLWTFILSIIPFFGERWARNSMKKTFYQQDSEDLFLQSIKKIVEALVEKVTSDKGFRLAQA